MRQRSKNTKQHVATAPSGFKVSTTSNGGIDLRHMKQSTQDGNSSYKASRIQSALSATAKRLQEEAPFKFDDSYLMQSAQKLNQLQHEHSFQHIEGDTTNDAVSVGVSQYQSQLASQPYQAMKENESMNNVYTSNRIMHRPTSSQYHADLSPPTRLNAGAPTSMRTALGQHLPL